MYSGREGDVQKKPSILIIRESLDLYFIFSFVTFLACPKKGGAQEGHPAKILHGMLGRPRYISETRPSGFGHPKCFTLVLGRLPKFSHGVLP